MNKRADALTALVVYVLPLAIVTILLWRVGLGQLALILLAIEAAVTTAVVIAARRPAPPAGLSPPSSRPWLVPLLMLAILLAIAGVAVLAAQLR